MLHSSTSSSSPPTSPSKHKLQAKQFPTPSTATETPTSKSRDTFAAATAADPNAPPLAQSQNQQQQQSRRHSSRKNNNDRDNRDGDPEWRDASANNAYTLASSSAKNSTPTVLFNISKKEAFTPNNGLKGLQRRLRNGFKIGLNKEEMNFSKFSEASLLIFGAPKEKFSMSEFGALKNFLEKGGSILYLTGEGGESEYNTNFNYLLEEYGMMVNPDCVTRTVYYKYFHPKEVFISNGILNRELNRAAGKKAQSTAISKTGVGMFGGEIGSVHHHDNKSHTGLSFVYPFGASLTVQKPAVPLLSSGTVSYPLNRPVAAAYINSVEYIYISLLLKNKGKIVVVGSGQMFSDTYIEKEENAKLFDVIIQLLTTDKIVLNPIDANEPDISDYHYLPDTAKLADNLRNCLQESEDVPKDFTTLFDVKLFNFDTRLVPEALKLYEVNDANISFQFPMKLKFETPLPPLQPAVFPPSLRELAPPSLDLFDLDEHFASERVRLAQITNKCNDDDLEYYIRECGEILGVTEKLSGLEEDKRDARHILEHVFNSIVNWKKLNQI
ncbi:Intraflagellar transport protein 52 [Physocladia obscura]|uniref:Intraflagellar transport protein 52 n=1 Tax=Physocladia obscura TaxID=109957 RepID=A0AAD5T679_9FUNG|nr:Intraflagellar transport protein 52 [Physocladia obscura]